MVWRICIASSWTGRVFMRNALTIARSEFILGGQKSGKSRRAETIADRDPRTGNRLCGIERGDPGER